MILEKRFNNYGYDERMYNIIYSNMATYGNNTIGSKILARLVIINGNILLECFKSDNGHTLYRFKDAIDETLINEYLSGNVTIVVSDYEKADNICKYNLLKMTPNRRIPQRLYEKQ